MMATPIRILVIIDDLCLGVPLFDPTMRRFAFGNASISDQVTTTTHGSPPHRLVRWHGSPPLVVEMGVVESFYYHGVVGLFRKSKKIAGTAQVVSCSAHRGEGRWQNCKMHLVVTIPGREPYPAEAHQIVPRKKWPQPGLTLPVQVSEDDPQKVKVDFDAAPTGEERARQMAEQQAAAMRGDTPTGSMPGAGFGTTHMPGQVNIVGDISQVPPDKLAKLEQMTGLDLDGDGTVGGVGGGGHGSPSDDRIGQLERLAQLRASGALSDEEFESEKRRLLG